MQKVLITGVAGMIGSHLLDELIIGNYSIVGIDNLSFGKIENIKHHLNSPKFSFYKADILDPGVLEKLGREMDIIIHLASVKKVSEADSCMATLEVNGEGTSNILKLAANYGSKVILASTSDVYGMSPDIPFQENGDLLLGPSNIKRWGYAVAKLFSEQLAFAFHQDYGLPVVVLRYFGGFSPRSCNSWSGGHIPIFLDAILNNRAVLIHGDGQQTRCMSYIDDLIHGTILAMGNPRAIGQVINIGNDEELNVLDTAILMHKLANTGTELKLLFKPIAEVFGDYKEIIRRKPDLSKAKNLIGYQPSISFEDGLKRVIATLKKKIKPENDNIIHPSIFSDEKAGPRKIASGQHAN
jgi:UDP-glucose 4-epimerase